MLVFIYACFFVPQSLARHFPPHMIFGPDRFRSQLSGQVSS